MAIWFILIGGTLQAQPVDSICQTSFAMQIAGNTYRIPICYNLDPALYNNQITRAVIVIHGSSRTAPDQLNYISEAAGMVPGTAGNTLLVAPQFLLEDDIAPHALDASYLFWRGDGKGWKYGFESDSTSWHPRAGKISSFEVIDRLIAIIYSQHPNLERIVVAGHSGGGQFAGRYGAGNRIQTQIGNQVEFRYVVANPSTYLYFSPERHVSGTTNSFAIPDAATINLCNNYDRYKYGLSDLNGCTYMEQTGVSAIRSQFQNRQFGFLLGAWDNNPTDPGMDQSCKATLEGLHRLSRGQLYFKYIQHYYGSSILQNHFQVIVPGVDHSSHDIYVSQAGRDYIFSDNLTIPATEITEAPHIKIYPNPSKEWLFLETSGRGFGELRMLDLQGRPVLDLKMNRTNQFKLPVRDLPSGTYILELETGGSPIHHRVIVVD